MSSVLRRRFIGRRTGRRRCSDRRRTRDEVVVRRLRRSRPDELTTTTI